MPYIQFGTKRRVFQIDFTSCKLETEESEIVDLASEHELGFKKYEETEDRK